ncbi:uncharacterized protein [Prorops nasuta]|uniref:uncharacterized protein n=1 Tax=Prorops nasuta TaxID=863751 RepID=UPI0034CF0BD7
MEQADSRDIEALNENFVYNDMLVRALVQLYSEEEKKHIHIWLEKLRNIRGNKETRMSRNNYMWLLLLVMKSGTLTEPFNKLPPQNELPPISELVPAHIFEEALSSTNQNFSWIEKMLSETNLIQKGNENNAIPPKNFLDHQPQPVNGISCYFSIFSKRT